MAVRSYRLLSANVSRCTKKTAFAIGILVCLFACQYHHDPVETARKDLLHRFPSLGEDSTFVENEHVFGANWAWIDKVRKRVYVVERWQNNWKIGLKDMKITVFRHECPALCISL